jgi:autotransporter-associated beta strand protein
LGTTGSTGILNLNGGVLEASVVTGYNGPSYAPVTGGQLNFNGGTLQASAASASFIAVTAANIYSGGATIDNNGNAITISQPLLAPTGNGVKVATFTGGAGYIAPPIVTVSNAPSDSTGTGATAIAQINPVTGIVTNVLITSPGVNYTAVPTFVVSSGGATTPATVTGMLTANTSGGFTAIGAGVTTLASANTYTGNTTISAGTLELAQTTLAESSTVSIASGATLQLDSSTTNIITGLVLNGTSQVPGIYNSTTTSYITGTGSLQVVSASFNTPTSITFAISGSGGSRSLSLTWPADHQGWILQAQTNSVGAGLGNNWVDVAGSAAGVSQTIPVSATTPTVFYRLRKP